MKPDSIPRRRGRSSASAASHEEPTEVAAEVHVALACCAEEQAAADRLVAMRYAWRGYVTKTELGRPSSDAKFPLNYLTLLAYRDDQSVGTLTIGFDTGGQLLVDQDQADIVDALRQAGRRVVELGRLAVHDLVDGKAVLAHLFRAAYRLGRVVHSATDVLIEINPRHAGFYARVFGFVRLGDEWICTRVNAPAVLMRLDVVDLERRLSRLKHQRRFRLAA